MQSLSKREGETFTIRENTCRDSAEGRISRIGKTQAVGDMKLKSHGTTEVFHAMIVDSIR